MSSRRRRGGVDGDDDAKFKWDWVAALLVLLAVVFVLLFTFEVWISHGN